MRCQTQFGRRPFGSRPGGAVWLTALLSLRVIAGAAQGADPGPAREYDVKAVFLFNFSQFVDWPESGLPEAGAPFVIGVLGADPFGEILDETVHGERIHGRPVQVKRFRRLDEVDGCQLLFVSRSEAGRLADVVRRLSGRGILTVSDLEPFGRLGGMITFKTSSGRVHFEINVAAAEKQGFKISSKLLKVAQVVGGEP